MTKPAAFIDPAVQTVTDLKELDVAFAGMRVAGGRMNADQMKVVE